MTTLITGGTGFVGLALAEALLRRGEGVVLMGISPAPSQLIDRAELASLATVIGDVTDPAAVRDIIAGHGVSRLVHAAAVTPNAEREQREAARIINVNAGGTAQVVGEALRHSQVARIIVLSSVAIYGFAPPGPQGDYDERLSHPAPSSLYGISKLAAEQTALRLAELAGRDVQIVRLGPVFGPWEHATGLRDNLSPHCQVLAAAQAGREVVLPRPMAADWIYSRDAAAVLAALTLQPRSREAVCNLGGGRTSDLPAWCQAIERHDPSLRWRVAGPGEEPTITYTLPQDRAPLAIGRIRAEIGGFAPRTLVEAAADTVAFLAEQDHP
ncbi:NAD(P)-dependent oxidoreductase [Geminicoccaceae bacterium 1502E]|nr:NAD(P)-dependent oxidoreductase [Geminicoccaceae bacterium 1502E]